MKEFFDKVTVFQGHYSSIDEIAHYYGIKDFEMLSSEECSNYSSKEFSVKPEFDEIDWMERLSRKDGFMFCTILILNRACFDGLIESGSYIIDCSW